MKTDNALPLLRLIPKQQPVVWGGTLLHTRLGKPAADEPIGESWEVWEEDPIEQGDFAGSTLRQICDRFPNQLLGTVPLRQGSTRFPLLTKFIDANEPLSVQVHPNDQQAQRIEDQPNGKTEAWYILQAKPDSWIIHGLNRTIGVDAFREQLLAGTADHLLRKVTPEVGDTFFVPAGTIHAIGPGVLLHEVQQTSDLTYRLYDWNRQADGSRRELHLDKGLEVSRLKPSPPAAVLPIEWREGAAMVTLLLASEYFAVKRLTLPGEIHFDTGSRSFHIVTVIDSSISIESELQRAELGIGQSAIVPACFGSYRLRSNQTASVLVEYVADIDSDIVPELQSHMISRQAIDAFLGQFRPPSS